MSMQPGSLTCQLYKGAFSKEVVFSFETAAKVNYEGIAPTHYASPTDNLQKEKPVDGKIKVQVITNGGDTALVAIPDGEAVRVPASSVTC